MKGKKSLTGRAWRLLRLALCWARKVVAFGTFSPPDDGIIRHGERELSFKEETQMFGFKKARARHGWTRMSCMNAPPEVELDMEEERDWGGEDEWVDHEEREEKGIDLRAAEFIRWFHEQLRMQRNNNVRYK